MPEGPEVKKLTIMLNKDFKNKKLLDIKILKGKYKKHGKPKNFNNLDFPLIVEKIDCKGKLIYFLFKNSNNILMVTLGMTGWFIYDHNEKHNNVLFKFSNDDIYFNDYRNFGNIIISNRDELNKKLNTLGPDILNSKDNSKLFLERIERKRNDTLICTALLDQKVACGVGNYLRAEALYIAKLSPFKEIKNISELKLKELWNILKQLGYFYYNPNKGRKIGIINNKYKLIDTFESSKNGPSKYKPKDGTFLIYRQKEDPYGNKVYSKEINGRTIHYVPKIQK
jgi:formamidopyrimidine-DNA glycosylase